MSFRKARFASRPVRAAMLMSAVSAVAPLGAGAPTARAQSTAIYGGVTFDETTGNGYKNASFPNATGFAVNDSGTAIGFADRYVGGVKRDTRAVLLNSTTAFELTGLVSDPTLLANSSAYSINTAGQVVGFANKQVGGVDVGDRAVRWDAAGNPLELGHLGLDAAGATNSYAYGLNSAGQSVGMAEKYVGGAYMGDLPVRWDAVTGAASELGNIGLNNSGQAFGVAYAINASSQAVGQMSKYDGNQYKGERAVAWNAAGAALELANLGLSNQQTYNFAYAINSSGQIAGYANKFSSGNKGDRAVRWDATTGAAVELATLGDSAGTTYAYGFAINDAGQVAGRSFKYVAGVYKGERAVRWNADGSALELAHLGLSGTDTTFASAFSINSLGQTAGRSKLYVGGVDQGDRAVYWNADGSVVDLNTLISPNSNWLLTRARAISDSGWITGFGLFDPDGAGALAAYQRHFLLRIAAENNWINPAGGDWETGGNWSSNFAPGAAVNAVFNLNSPGGYTVNLSAAAQANNLIVRTDKLTLNLAGQTLTLNGLIVGRDSGDVAHLTIAGGTLNAPTLTVNDTSKLDLGDNKLITSSAAGTWNGTAYTGVAGLVDSGRGSAGNAMWDGPAGITTSDTRAINNGDLVSIGVAKVSEVRTVADTETTTFAGQTVLGSDTLAMVTWGGDANLDGKINIDDYGRIDGNVGQSGSVFGWSKGDFNYDGKINIDDYGIIDGNINRQGAPFATTASLDGVAAVPEPTAVAVLSAAAILCMRHRRYR